MTDITEAKRIALATIPPEAVEAAKREMAVAIYRLVEPDTRAHELTENEVAEIATAALRAGIAAWPGIVGAWCDGDATWFENHFDDLWGSEAIILPLPQENINAEG